jgi:hypothetical protein
MFGARRKSLPSWTFKASGVLYPPMRPLLKTIRPVSLLILGLTVAYFGLFFCLMRLDEEVWREEGIGATCVFRWSRLEISGGPRGSRAWWRWSAWNDFFQPAEVIVNRIRGKENLLQEYRDAWDRWAGHG